MSCQISFTTCPAIAFGDIVTLRKAQVEKDTKIRVMDFVSMIVNTLPLLPADNDNLDILIRVESQLAFNKLKLCLHKYSADETPLNLSHIKYFCGLLSDRWYYIKHTDACYPHNEQTRANRAYLTLAVHLCLEIKEQVYNILMPTVGAIFHVTSRDNLSCFKLHEFALGDASMPIEIGRCLDDAVKNKTSQLYHTGIYNKPLNESEKQRVIHHSKEAYDYYDAIQFYVQAGFINDLLMAHKILHEKLKSDDYAVTATYGQAGRKRLSKAVLSYIKNQTELIELMVKLPQCEWKNFLKDMDYEDIFNLATNHDSFIKALQKQSAYKADDEKYNKALLFCMVEIYKRERVRGNFYKNNWGYLKSLGQSYLGNYNKFIQSYTKEEQIAATECLQAFIMSNRALKQINEYLDSDPPLAIHKGPLFETASDLYYIVYQLQQVSDPAYFHKQPSRFLPKFF